MTEPSRHPGTPPWVKGLGIASLVLVLLAVVALLSGHGPGRHLGSGPAGPAAPEADRR